MMTIDTLSLTNHVLTLNNTDRTDSGPQFDELYMYLAYVASAAYILISVLGTFFNVVAVVVPLRYRHLRHNPFNILIINMAVVDLICCLSLPLNACVILGYQTTGSLANLGCYASAFVRYFTKLMYFAILSEMAVIRAVCISCSGLYRIRLSKRFLASLIALHTTVALAFTTYRNLNNNICHGFDSIHTNYIWINTGLTVTLLVILCAGYACILLVTCRHAASMSKVTDSADSHWSKHNLATIRTSVLIVTWYMLCHIPFFLLIVLVATDVVLISFITYSSFFVFVSLSHIANPVILFCSSKDFRKHVILAFKRV